jgi:phosphatidylinositol alpha-1,6-mannosyltransferase
VAGELDDADLIAAYAAADVMVFPAIARPGDVEGFGMVIVEAAAQGTPAVAFALGGIPDAISARNGILVAPGDHAAFAAAINRVLGGTGGCTPQSCREHAEDYGWTRYGARLRELMRAVTGAAT